MYGRGQFAGLDTYYEHFAAYPGAFADKGGDRVDQGGKVLLPASVLGALAQKNVVYPLQFCVQTFKGRKSYCGVLEFTAPEGQAIIPMWMLQQLHVDPGATVRFTAVSMPRGGLVKLRPQEKAFIELSNPKAVLEHALKNYTVLTKGQSIVVNYMDKDYMLDIMEAKDEEMRDVDAIFIIDTNLKVDFDRPLDMPASPVKPAPSFPAAGAVTQGANVIGGDAGTSFNAGFQYKPPSLTDDKKPKAEAKEEEEPAKPNFVAFGGSGRSLSGKPLGGGAAPGSSASSGAAPPTAKPREEEQPKEFKAFGGAGRSLK